MESNSHEQEHVQLALKLLSFLDRPGQGTRRVVEAAMRIDPMWALYAEDLAISLISGDETIWAKLLAGVFRPEYRFIRRYPRNEFGIDWSKGEKLDLYVVFKAFSPFADNVLMFFPMQEGLAEMCEEVLHKSQWCSDYDEFMFVAEDTASGQKIRPIWIRPKPGSPLADQRTGPAITV